MWPLHGGTLGIWRSSYPDLTTYLNPKGISSSVATYCGIGSASRLPLRRRPELPFRCHALGCSVHHRCSASARDQRAWRSVSWFALVRPALGPGTTTFAVTMLPRVV